MIIRAGISPWKDIHLIEVENKITKRQFRPCNRIQQHLAVGLVVKLSCFFNLWQKLNLKKKKIDGWYEKK